MDSEHQNSFSVIGSQHERRQEDHFGFSAPYLCGNQQIREWASHSLEAMKMGIPAVIHEQNAFPGVTNKMLTQNKPDVRCWQWKMPRSISIPRLTVH